MDYQQGEPADYQSDIPNVLDIYWGKRNREKIIDTRFTAEPAEDYRYQYAIIVDGNIFQDEVLLSLGIVAPNDGRVYVCHRILPPEPNNSSLFLASLVGPFLIWVMFVLAVLN